jgi:hypothetical protein
VLTDQPKCTKIACAFSAKIDQILNCEELERIRYVVYKSVPDALVTGYEHLIDSIEPPDRDDWHVLAAAIHRGASVIVTLNPSDFPKQTLQHFSRETQHPNDSSSRFWKPMQPSCSRQRAIIVPASRTCRKPAPDTLHNSTPKPWSKPLRRFLSWY